MRANPLPAPVSKDENPQNTLSDAARYAGESTGYGYDGTLDYASLSGDAGTVPLAIQGDFRSNADHTVDENLVVLDGGGERPSLHVYFGGNDEAMIFLGDGSRRPLTIDLPGDAQATERTNPLAYLESVAATRGDPKIVSHVEGGVVIAATVTWRDVESSLLRGAAAGLAQRGAAKAIALPGASVVALFTIKKLDVDSDGTLEPVTTRVEIFARASTGVEGAKATATFDIVAPHPDAPWPSMLSERTSHGPTTVDDRHGRHAHR